MLEYLNYENIQLVLSILGAILTIVGLIGVKNIRDISTLIETAKTNFNLIKEIFNKLIVLKNMVIEAKKDGVWDEEELNTLYEYITTEFTYDTEQINAILQNLEDGFDVLKNSAKVVKVFLKLKLKL